MKCAFVNELIFSFHYSAILCDFQRPRSLVVAPRYNDVIMSAMASQITILTTVYSTVYSGADQRKYQSSASLALVMGIHWWPVNSPHKGPVTWKMFPFDDVIIYYWVLAWIGEQMCLMIYMWYIISTVSEDIWPVSVFYLIFETKMN